MMESGQRDTYSARQITNTFEKGFHTKYIANNSFFPMVEIRALQNQNYFLNRGIDIFKDAKSEELDIQKLK